MQIAYIEESEKKIIFDDLEVNQMFRLNKNAHTVYMKLKDTNLVLSSSFLEVGASVYIEGNSVVHPVAEVTFTF